MLKGFFNVGLYVLMLGPPHAIRIHTQAQGHDHELNGVPLWIAVLAEFMVRMGIFILIVFVYQSWITNEVFRLFHMEVFFVVVCIAGFMHTGIYTLCFAYLWSRLKKAKVLKFYRVLRNLIYSVIPGMLAAGAVLKWQQYNQVAMFHGNEVQIMALSVWGVVMVAGLLEALLRNTMPHGIDRSNVKNPS